MAEEKMTALHQQKDHVEKTLECHPDVFADISNALIFKKKVIREEQLKDGPTESIYKADDARTSKEQRRDVAKYVENAGIQMIFVGMENQSGIDKDMAIRVMGYDYATYRSQIVSGDHRYPAISAVLYFGEERWNAARSLKEIVDLPEELSEQFVDYRINLIDVPRLPKEEREKLKSDFRVIADYFADRDGKEDQSRSMRTLKHPVEVADFFRVFTGDQRFVETMEEAAKMEQEGRVVRVCDLFDKAEARGRREGHQEGRREGEIRKLIQQILKKVQKGQDSQTIAEALEEDESYIRNLMEVISRYTPDYSEDSIYEELITRGDCE